MKAKNLPLLVVPFLFVLAVPQLQAQNPATTPRGQLQQLTAQLQQSPGDQALREKIIALALALNPRPATPDAATMAEGAAEYAFKNAKATSDYSDAAKQYEKALLLAPWLAADYFNCGVAYEKAGDNKEAIHSFNLYLLAAPNADDALAVKKRIGGLQYAADSPEGKAEAEFGPSQNRFSALMQKLDGAVFVRDRMLNGDHLFYEVRFYRIGRYHLLACDRREKTNWGIVPVGTDPHGAWENTIVGEYVIPTNGRDMGPRNFIFKTNGIQEFILGCMGDAGRLSADGQTIDVINSYRFTTTEEIIEVWHRQ